MLAWRPGWRQRGGHLSSQGGSHGWGRECRDAPEEPSSFKEPRCLLHDHKALRMYLCLLYVSLKTMQQCGFRMEQASAPQSIASVVLSAADYRKMVLDAGFGRVDSKQAAPKAPPHSFLPNLQPGRASPAARRGEVLAGPLTRASTPQPRSQVCPEPSLPYFVRQVLP